MQTVTSSIKRVACALSGGVDSAVAAWLLKKRGYEVVGIYMKNWDSQDEAGTCVEGADDLDDARSVAEALDIKFEQVSFIKEYWHDVFSSLLEDYENGRTPNPDIFCNRFIKFGAFYRYAFQELGVDALATGHYARSSFGPYLENYNDNMNVELLRAVDPVKDQTLFLSQVKQEALRRTMFPLGDLHKKQVRDLAETAGLTRVSKKPDSTGICFIGSRKFQDFISEYIQDRPGPFVDIETNQVVAYHKGVHHYTIGQRCRIADQLKRYYIASRDPASQTILVASGAFNPALFGNEVFTSIPHWISYPPHLSLTRPFTCMFRFQHADRAVPCQIYDDGKGGVRIDLALPVRAVTPGQIAVFYKKDSCIGSAKILSSGWKNDARMESAAHCASG